MTTFGQSREPRGPSIGRVEFVAMLQVISAAMDQPSPSPDLVRAIRRLEAIQKEPVDA